MINIVIKWDKEWKVGAKQELLFPTNTRALVYTSVYPDECKA